MENENEGLAVPTPGGTLLDIRELSIRCRELLHQSSADDSSADGVEARELMASFNIWVANMGVFHEGRQSVASRLRSAPQIRELTQQLLVVLKHDLEKGVLQGDNPEEDQSASESDDSSDRSSAPSYRILSPSDDDEDRISAPSRPTTWNSIRDTITSLRQLALTLRLAGAQHRQEQIRRFKDLDRNKQVYQIFERCARQRVDWLFPRSSKILRERMAESVATRRARFLYLEEHQKKISTLSEPAPVLRQEEAYEENKKPDALPVVQTGQQQQDLVRSRVQPSVIHSTTTVTKLDPAKLYPAQNNIKPAESVSSVKISIDKVPSPPKLDPEGTSFTCPYCFLVCPAKEASGTGQWMNHLIHDFEPFFCVFDECSSPFTCAGTYTGWLAHMRDTHTQPSWCCFYCNNAASVFSTPAEFEQHLEERHREMATGSLRLTLIKHSMVRDQHALQECPFCGGFPEEIDKAHPDRDSEKAREALEKHVREHLVSVALILAPADTGEPGGEPDDTESEAMRGSDSERNLDEVGDTYDLECQDSSCDCKERKKNSAEPSYSSSPTSQEYNDLERDDSKLEEYLTTRSKLEETEAKIIQAKVRLRATENTVEVLQRDNEALDHEKRTLLIEAKVLRKSHKTSEEKELEIRKKLEERRWDRPERKYNKSVSQRDTETLGPDASRRTGDSGVQSGSSSTPAAQDIKLEEEHIMTRNKLREAETQLRQANAQLTALSNNVEDLVNYNKALDREKRDLRADVDALRGDRKSFPGPQDPKESKSSGPSESNYRRNESHRRKAAEESELAKRIREDKERLRGRFDHEDDESSWETYE